MSTEQCPTCKKPYEGFRDDAAIHEFKISGMCQTCQDHFAGKLGPKPSGICLSCGDLIWSQSNTCNPKCEAKYFDFLREQKRAAVALVERRAESAMRYYLELIVSEASKIKLPVNEYPMFAAAVFNAKMFLDRLPKIQPKNTSK